MKILWGPFNHEAIDTYLLENLDPSQSKTFGPYGADLIVPGDCRVASNLAQQNFDCVVLIEPLLRQVPPVIFELGCPKIVCCSHTSGLSQIIDYIDGIIPMMTTALEFEPFNKPIAANLFPIKMRPPNQSLPKIYPIACLGSGVNLTLFKALENLGEQVYYLQGLKSTEIAKHLLHTSYAFIPDPRPVAAHFEALQAGCTLIIPDIAELISALHLPRQVFCTYDPQLPETSLSKLFSTGQSIENTEGIFDSPSQIITDLLHKLRPGSPSKKSLTDSDWLNYSLTVLMQKSAHFKQKFRPTLTQAQALIQQMDAFSQNTAQDLWPLLEAYFAQSETFYQHEDSQALLNTLPWHPGLRAQLAPAVLQDAYLSRSDKQKYIQSSLSLLKRSPAWVTLKLEVLSKLLKPYVAQFPVNTSSKPLVLLEGPVYSYTSFARVNLPLLKAWQSSEHFDLTLAHSGRQSLLPEFPDLDFKDDYRLPAVVITHHFPHREAMPDWGKRIAIMPWEYGIAPKHTVQIIKEEIDETWVPSQFNFDIYVRCGVDPARLQVIPNGVDTQLYKDHGPVMKLATNKSFKFCYVGGTIPRKGFDILLNTYINTFSPEDDVCLVIKDYGGKEQYSSDSLHHQILKFAQDPSKPAIVYLYTDFMTEADLTSLFRACDVYVHPYRGEGFGMGILEAMACGLPAIIPDQGPAPEFCPLEASWQVSGLTHFMMPSPTKKEFEIQYYTDLPSFYHEPDGYFLAKAMKEAVAQPETCRQKSKAARQAALKYDWQIIAARAEQRIRKALDPGIPLRLQSPPSRSESSQSTLRIPSRKTPGLDFDRFHPFVQPQAKGLAYGILSICRWGNTSPDAFSHWQTLLMAFARLQTANKPVRLILAAPDRSNEQIKQDIQAFCLTQKLRFDSHLMFDVHAIPQNSAEVLRLYQKATVFVDTDPLSSGHWHLLAQAMGIRTISSGQQLWLQHPFTERIKSQDSIYLAWLLSKILANKQSIFDGLAVREHLKAQYHTKEMPFESFLIEQEL